MVIVFSKDYAVEVPSYTTCLDTNGRRPKLGLRGSRCSRHATLKPTVLHFQAEQPRLSELCLSYVVSQPGYNVTPIM